MSMDFHNFSRFWAHEIGRPRSFFLACLFIILWLLAGFHYGFMDPLYQLFINTTTTILSFLILFLVQGSVNRDTLELNLKLNELIRASETAHNRMINLEKLTERQIERLHSDFRKVGDRNGTA